MQEYVGQVPAKIRSVRYLIKWHRILSNMLKTILFLIIICVFEEIKLRDIQCAFLIHQIEYIHINKLLIFCDTPHNTKSVTE